MKALLSIALGLFSALSLAQTNRTETSIAPSFADARFSPSFGIMLTDFSVSGNGATVSTTPEVGFSLGMDVYIPSSSPYVDYQSGFYYWNSRTRVESRFSNTSLSLYNNSLIEVKRLSLPLIAKIYPFQKSSGFYTRAGVFNHFLIEATEDSTTYISQKTSLLQNNTDVETNNRRLTSADGYKSYTLDAVVGAGFESTIGRSFAFMVELNYLYGLTPVASGPNEIRSDSYYATFGIGF